MIASNAARPPSPSGRLRAAGSLIAASLAVLALSACARGDDPTRVAGWTLVDTAQRHPILVSQEPTVHFVRVSRGSNGLSPSQRAQLLDFTMRYRATDSGNSRLVVAVPSGSRNEVAAMYAVGEVRDLLRDRGFGEPEISVEAYSAEGAVDPPIRVSYMRYVAEAPACGDWSTNLAHEPMNLPYPNLGCAQQRNLAVQVANPGDLLGPRSQTARSSERRDTVFNKYIRGEPTGSKKSADERVNKDTSQ